MKNAAPGFTRSAFVDTSRQPGCYVKLQELTPRVREILDEMQTIHGNRGRPEPDQGLSGTLTAFTSNLEIADVRDGRIVDLREYNDSVYSNEVFARNLPLEVLQTFAGWSPRPVKAD